MLGVVGVVVGTVVAELVLAGGGTARGAPRPAELAVAGAALLLPIVVDLTASAALERADRGHDPVVAGRAAGLAPVGLVVLAIAATAFTGWRFVQDGGAGADPVAPLAPAALLCTIALLGLLALGPLLRSAELGAPRARGIGFALAARSLARGASGFAAPVVLVALAVGVAIFAAGFAGTTAGFIADSSRVATGAAVRVDLDAGGSVASSRDRATLDPAARAAGVTAAVPALRSDESLGGDDLDLVAVDVRRLAQLMPVGAYLLDAPRLAGLLRGADPLPGIELRGAHELSVDSSSSPVTIWLLDPAGELVPVSPDPTVAVPAGGPWRIVAVDLTTAAGGHAASLRGLEADGAALPLTGTWRPVAGPFGLARLPAPDPEGIGFTGLPSAASPSAFPPSGPPPEGPRSVRLMPSVAQPVAIVVTAGAARQARPGDAVQLSGDLSVDTRLAGVVPAVPATGDAAAALADIRGVDAAMLRSLDAPVRMNTLLLDADDPSAAGRAAGEATEGAAVTVAGGGAASAFTDPVSTSLWLAAAGCAALALIAFIAAIAASASRRRPEIAVLRSLGATRRQQAGLRRAEAGVLVGVALFVGVVGGAAAELFAGNLLARAAVPSAPATYPVTARLDVLPLAVVLVVLVVALALVVLVDTARTGRAAERERYREEAR